MLEHMGLGSGLNVPLGTPYHAAVRYPVGIGIGDRHRDRTTPRTDIDSDTDPEPSTLSPLTSTSQLIRAVRVRIRSPSLASGSQNLQVGGGVGEVRRIACDDALGTLSPGERCMQRIVDAASHHAAGTRLRDRLLVVRQR